MGKHILYLILISVIAMYFINQIAAFLHFIDNIHGLLVKQLSMIFAGGKVGMMIKEVVALVLIPLGIASIPASVYWVFKRRVMPYFTDLLWVSWIMLATSVALH